MTRLPRAVLIAGPTASGKSAFAMKLAAARGGTIINADSMQVYRDLRVLTARPSLADEQRLPHQLYGFVAGSEAYSSGRYARDAADAIAACHAGARLPVIVGGTGLYFQALLKGLSPIPAIPDAVRSHWRGVAAEMPVGDLYRLLAERDPHMAARLRPTDPQRVTRALEVLDATGHSLAYWQAQPGTPVLAEEDTERFVLQPDRDALYGRCDGRFDAMLESGALDEVKALVALGLDAELPLMRAVGVPPLVAHLAGEISLAVAVEDAKRDTRNYVKRQSTWLRRNMNTWKPITL